MLLLANFFWGLSFPTIKALVLLQGTLVPGAGTWFSTVYTVAPRFLFAVLVMIALRPRSFWRVTRAELKQGVTIGGFTGAGMLLQNDGLQFTAASTSAFLTQVYAVMIPVVLAVRARRSPGWLVWSCCVLVLAGVAILGRFDPFDQLRAGWHESRFGRGEWETLASALFFMGTIFCLDRKDYAANRPDRITLAMFVTEGVIFWTLAAATAPGTDALLAPWHSGAWVGLTSILALFCTVGAFGLMNAWQPKITATEAGLIYCVEPIFGSAMALFLPAIFSAWAAIDYANERATWHLLAGGGLITFANVLIQFKPPPKT